MSLPTFIVQPLKKGQRFEVLYSFIRISTASRGLHILFILFETNVFPPPFYLFLEYKQKILKANNLWLGTINCIITALIVKSTLQPYQGRILIGTINHDHKTAEGDKALKAVDIIMSQMCNNCLAMRDGGSKNAETMCRLFSPIHTGWPTLYS